MKDTPEHQIIAALDAAIAAVKRSKKKEETSK